MILLVIRVIDDESKVFRVVLYIFLFRYVAHYLNIE